MPTPRRSARRVLALACACVVAMSAADSTAGEKDATWGSDATARARAAYDRGVRAHAAGDHAAAARAFAEADALVPDGASLEAALESSIAADDAVLGAELLDRATGRAADAGLARTIAAARRRFAGRTGTLQVDCENAPSCLVSVDGVAGDATKPLYVKPGPRAVVVQRGRERIERIVDVVADRVTVVPPKLAPVATVAPVASDRPARALDSSSSRGGLSPTWFWVGAGATAVAGAFTALSGVFTLEAHERFEQGGCGLGATGPRAADCDARGEGGRSDQARTNILLGATAVFAVATAVLGVFVVDWSGGGRARVTARGFELVLP
ncbi:MAG: hypothetical protein KF819_03805 [Labilithrix sp.]|nr:hypothetical protein [Labilithrix sp.]